MGAPQLRCTLNLVVTMKYISPLISDARGSLGGTTFARNRAGVYTRARVAPTQPRTDSQQANRAGFATLAQQWKTLSTSQIDGWNLLASGETLTDTLGHSYMPSGMQLFISCNRNLNLIGDDTIEEPPNAKPSITAVTGVSSLAFVHLGNIDNITVTVPGYITYGSPALIISASAPVSPGIRFVARHRLRQLKPPFEPFSGVAFIQPQYVALFGSAYAGTNFALRVQAVDRETGFASVATQILVPFIEE